MFSQYLSLVGERKRERRDNSPEELAGSLQKEIAYATETVTNAQVKKIFLPIASHTLE